MLEFQNRKHISEFEAMQIEKDDIIFDKELELKEMQKQLNHKDREINDLLMNLETLRQNPENQVNDLECFDKQSNANFIQNKRHSMLSGSKREFMFHGQSEYQKSQFRE